MNEYKIITDSTADLKEGFIKENNIDVLPLTLHIGEETYKDGETLTLREMFKKIEDGSDFPTTSQVNPEDFYKSFKNAIEQGYENIICVIMTSNLSGTYQSAKIAKDMLISENIKFKNLALIDSKALSGGTYLIILEVLKMIKEGKDFDVIVKNAEIYKEKIKTLVYFDTLTHLVKGGRLPKAVGALGGLLSIKPILTLKDGFLHLIKKVKGRKRGLIELKKFINNADIKEGTKVVLINSINDDMENKYISFLKDKKIEYMTIEIGCVLGVQGGPGILGVFYVEN